MNDVHIREARSEVLIFLDRHLPDNLAAMKAAQRKLQAEITREESNPLRNANWKPDDSL